MPGHKITKALAGVLLSISCLVGFVRSSGGRDIHRECAVSSQCESVARPSLLQIQKGRVADDLFSFASNRSENTSSIVAVDLASLEAKEFPLARHAVVLKNFGAVSSQLNLVRLYMKLLQSTGVKLGVLNDNGKRGASIDGSTILLPDSNLSIPNYSLLQRSNAMSVSVTRMGASLNITTDMLIISESSSVPVCQLSWDTATKTYGTSTMKGVEGFGGHSAHDQYLSLWYSHCKASWKWNDVDYVWFFENDARFSGQIVRFIEAYADDDADLVASGFRIAGQKWWKFNGIPANVRDWGLFTRNQSLVRNLSTLPTLSDGACTDGTKDDEGVLFFQDHVLRASSRLLANLDNVIEDGFLGPSESFIAHFCAHQIGSAFKGRSSCTIVDFAPVVSQQRHDQWVSSWWCWGGTVFSLSDKLAQCTDEKLKNKWFHKVEQSRDPFDFDCP